MTIEQPNTHPLFDPVWGEAQVVQHYAKQITLGRDLAHYSADLLLRSLESAPDDIPNHMVLSILFRNAVVAIDGAVVLMAAAAVGAAGLPVRALLETRWGLTLALSDPAKWGLHIYVSSRRADLLRARRSIPGTPEHAAFAAGYRLVHKDGTLPGSFKPEDAQELAGALNRILAKPEYSAVNAVFEAAAKPHREQPWYFDGGPTSTIRSLASRAAAEEEYLSVYQELSNQVHPGRILDHLRRDETAYYLAHVRSPEGFRSLFVLLVALAADCCRKVIEQYRPGELAGFVSRYVESCRPVIASTTEVEIALNRIANQPGAA